MIKEIEIIERLLSEETIIKINLETNTIIEIKNNNITTYRNIKNNKEFINLISKYTLSWDKTYKANNILDGKTTTISICTNITTETYTFKNKFPPNYDEFIKEFRKLVLNDIK